MMLKDDQGVKSFPDSLNSKTSGNDSNYETLLFKDDNLINALK